jgi:hypothetical protein
MNVTELAQAMHQFIISSTCQFINLHISSSCHFINLPFINLLFHQLAISSTCHFINLPFQGVGKITLLLSARFRSIFIAIKRKHLSLHYTFNGNFIKIMYNRAYHNSNANGNYGVNV